jgi:hypothetical protein
VKQKFLLGTCKPSWGGCKLKEQQRVAFLFVEVRENFSRKIFFFLLFFFWFTHHSSLDSSFVDGAGRHPSTDSTTGEKFARRGYFVLEEVFAYLAKELRGDQVRKMNFMGFQLFGFEENVFCFNRLVLIFCVCANHLGF